MMEEEGELQLDPGTLIEVLRRKLSEAIIREADLESAIQLLIRENQMLQANQNAEVIDIDTAEEPEFVAPEEVTPL